jgi:transposase InsO family protein
MKQQIANRLGAAHVRDTVMQFAEGSMTREQAMESLGVGKTRLYELRTSFLAAKASGMADAWEPSRSGGNHMPAWPDEAQRFLKHVLSPDGDARRYSYAFAASEVGRKFGLSVDRAQVRHWAIDHGIKIAVPKPRPPAHVRRWQRKSIGELWQLDATPDYFLGRGNPSLSLIDMIDDCSRMQVGCRLYRSENVPAYLDLFYRAFTRYGLPLEIYVDKASFFRNDDGSLTRLAQRLKFLDVSFIFANTPEAKGKIERVHQVWQDRLPAYAAHEGITAQTPLEDVNDHLECLVDHRNGFEIHRELHDTPQNVWDKAVKEGRCKIRQPPRDGWFELLWAEWKCMRIGPRGRLLVDGVLCPTECANGTKVWVCRHVDGTVSLVLNKPIAGTVPQVVFTNNPAVKRS